MKLVPNTLVSFLGLSIISFPLSLIYDLELLVPTLISSIIFGICFSSIDVDLREEIARLG